MSVEITKHPPLDTSSRGVAGSYKHYIGIPEGGQQILITNIYELFLKFFFVSPTSSPSVCTIWAEYGEMLGKPRS